MKLIEILNQQRRDFIGIYECEGCKNKEGVSNGYDDRYFHDEVMPNRKCKKCGESTNSLGLTKQMVNTRYAEGEVV